LADALMPTIADKVASIVARVLCCRLMTDSGMMF
jgi:hypothetical protein